MVTVNLWEMGLGAVGMSMAATAHAAGSAVFRHRLQIDLFVLWATAGLASVVAYDAILPVAAGAFVFWGAGVLFAPRREDNGRNENLLRAAVLLGFGLICLPVLSWEARFANTLGAMAVLGGLAAFGVVGLLTWFGTRVARTVKPVEHLLLTGPSAWWVASNTHWPQAVFLLGVAFIALAGMRIQERKHPMPS